MSANEHDRTGDDAAVADDVPQDDDVEGHGFKVEGFDGPVTTARLAGFHQPSATSPHSGGPQHGQG